MLGEDASKMAAVAANPLLCVGVSECCSSG